MSSLQCVMTLIWCNWYMGWFSSLLYSYKTFLRLWYAWTMVGSDSSMHIAWESPDNQFEITKVWRPDRWCLTRVVSSRGCFSLSLSHPVRHLLYGNDGKNKLSPLSLSNSCTSYLFFGIYKVFFYFLGFWGVGGEIPDPWPNSEIFRMTCLLLKYFGEFPCPSPNFPTR
jgi:hypothetical protein